MTAPEPCCDYRDHYNQDLVPCLCECHIDPPQDLNDSCHDACTRNICEWCPEADRQAALVAEFNAALDRELS